MHAQGDLGGDHERTQVQRGLAARGRDPILVDLGDLAQGLDELIHRQLRHSHALGRVGHAIGVGLRTERGNGAIRLAVGLDALEDGLAVVENIGSRVHAKRRVRAHLSVVPAVLLVPVNGDHVVGEVLTKARVLENLRKFLRGGRVGVLRHGVVQSHGL